MKKPVLIILVFLTVMLALTADSRSQSTTNCRAQNFVQDSAHSMKFDVYLKNTSGTAFMYAKGQFMFHFNKGVIPVGKTAQFIKESTGLVPASLAPGTNAASVYTTSTPGQLRSSVNTYSTGVGHTLASGDSVKIATFRFRISDGTPFVSQSHNIVFRPGVTAPVTQVWKDNAFVDALEDITANMTKIDMPDAPLPVEFASFTANVTNTRDVTLSWRTAKEVNNKGFEIERKKTDGTWSKVGYMDGKGTTYNETSYKFDDKKLNSGKYNYRLKQVDYNGNFEYHALSSTIEVGLPTSFDLSQNYPNPFNPTTKIDYQIPSDGKVSILIYDMTGREVKKLLNNEVRSAGYYTIDFNGSNIASGTYFYRFIAESNAKQTVMTKKMVLIK